MLWLYGFQGIAAVGGFSCADVPDSVKGWAATILFNASGCGLCSMPSLSGPTTFCNGCHLFGLLDAAKQPRFVRNTSDRLDHRTRDWTARP